MIERCWSKSPVERPTFGEIFTLLSNQNNQEEEDFMLNDVDADELNLYTEDMPEVTDGTEKLLSKISKIESENKQLKHDFKSLKLNQT